MDPVKMFNKLCDPAKLYLGLSLLSVFLYIMSMESANNTLRESDDEHEGIRHYTFMGLFGKIFFTCSSICCVPTPFLFSEVIPHALHWFGIFIL